MDAGMAERLAKSMDPKALSQLQNRNSDPAVARAVAAQFGSFLMQGMMQDSDGSAMSIAGGGTGSAAVSAMFASAMGRYAMSGDKLGLADTIYRSMAEKGAPSTARQDAPADSAPASAPASATAATTPVQGTGFSLSPYWQDHGHRPIGAATGHMNQPAGVRGLEKAQAGASIKTRHDPAVSRAAPAPSASPVVKTVAPAVATAVAPAPTPTPHRTAHPRWLGLSLPQQAHVLLPSAETDPPDPSATASVAPSAPQANAPAPAVSGDTAAAPVPYGLPWSHQNGGAETGAPTQHHAAATRAGAPAWNEAENFAEEVAPAIEHAAARLGVSPRVLLAQAALETGWGHSVVGNNIFGIKAGASWSGATVTAGTHEMEGGHLVARQATFRSYGNVDQAVEDYVALVSASDRYRAAMGSGDNVAAYAHALEAGGYASDRDYAAKLAAVADSSKMSYAVASIEGASPGQLISSHG